MHITYRYPQQPAITFIVMSFFLVIIFVLCKHYAGGTCILHCALFNNYYTQLTSHQLQLHKRRKKLRASLPLFYIIVFWPFDNLLSKWHFMDFMQRISQTRNVTYFRHLHDFMFSEKKMKKLMKYIEDSFEYTQGSDEFEQIHNAPEK